MVKTLLVVGGGAGGMAAASKAKRTNPELRVVVLEAKNHVSHAPCGLPFFLAGYFDDPNMLVHYGPEVFKKRGIDVLLRTKATKIDFSGRIVYAIDQREKEYEFEYDYLVLAMGAKPRRLHIDGEDLDCVYYIRHIDDGIPIKQKLKKAENIVLIGAGYINVELAEAFIHQQKKVTMITRGDRILSKLDPDMSEIVEKDMIAKKVNIRKNEHVVGCEGSNNELRKVITDKDEYKAEIAIVGIGIEPNTDIVNGSKIGFGIRRTIKTNEKMETNIENVYAVGDLAETKNIVTGKPSWFPLAHVANKMGRTAGSNIGGVDMKFFGAADTTFVKFFETAVAQTGLSTKQAQSENFEVKSVKIEALNKPRYYPDASKVYIKLIYDSKTRKLLGGQAIGGQGVDGKINVVAAALYAGLRVEEIFQLDLGYSPPFSPVWDPLIVASSVSMRDLIRKK